MTQTSRPSVPSAANRAAVGLDVPADHSKSGSGVAVEP